MNFSKNPYIKVKDYSVSGETFELLFDEELQLLKTYPQPSLDKLASYYESQDYISHTDSKRTWFEKIYHFIRRRAIRQKVDLIEYCNGEKGKVLDIGCGKPDFLRAMRQHTHADCFGIDALWP
jgi:ubiquinone/menaquinone biosynthesis C-methylase UbiE